MPRIREQVEIAAPVDRIWKAVHQDIPKVPRWSKTIARTEVVGGGPVGAGTKLRYTVRLPGGLTQDLELDIATYDLHRRCAGTVSGMALRGTWMWTYRQRKELTVVVYETDVQLRGVLRFAGPIAHEQVRRDVRSDLAALKRHVEHETR